MQIVNVGSFYCKYCKKDIPTRVHADHPDLVLKYRDDALGMAKNFHWYDYHYNCALCGKWIPSGERELILEKDYQKEIHPKYNQDLRFGLLRVHTNCIKKV